MIIYILRFYFDAHRQKNFFRFNFSNIWQYVCQNHYKNKLKIIMIDKN